MSRVMKAAEVLLGLAGVVAALPGPVGAAELQKDTLKAWDEYVRNADARIRARLSAGRPFLWADESPDRILRLRRGEIVVAPVVGHGTRSVPHALVHDWIGAAFLPNATLEGLLSVIHDYDRYKDFYKPVVADSKAIANTGAGQKFTMTWRHRVLFIDAAVEGQYEAHDTSLGGRRGYNIAGTTQVREIQDYGQSGEKLLPAGEGSGYIWRLHSIARYEERDGGVYLELEAIALTRDIPLSLAWLVSPVVHRLSINSLTTTLAETRDAVRSNPELVASCSVHGPMRANRKAGCGD